MRLRHAFLFFITGLLFLFCSNPETQYLPSSINGYKLDKKLTGDEARQFVNRLHGKPVAPQENEIGFYKQGDKELVLYLTYYAQADQAQQDWQKMVQKISEGHAIFVQGKNLEMEGYSVFRCFGMGQTHFVFVHQNTLIWFTVPTIGSGEFFKAYVQYLK